MSDPLDQVSIVLVEPAVPGNVGSVARVLRNTGVSRLVLVRPGEWRTAECEWMAHGSGEILDEARVVEDLEEAIADCEVVLGTTHRLGRFRVVDDDYRAALAETAAEAAGGGRIAILFGREKDGLSRAELLRCQRLIRIPSAVAHPSFNLSHAVLLVAYELFRRLGEPLQKASAAPLATAGQTDRPGGPPARGDGDHRVPSTKRRPGELRARPPAVPWTGAPGAPETPPSCIEWPGRSASRRAAVARGVSRVPEEQGSGRPGRR